MIAGIELGKNYAQVCVKTDRMRDAESVTRIAGTEHYRIPVEIDIREQSQLQELFRKLWKMLSPYGTQESLDYLVFCLEENTEEMRQMLLEITKIYNISLEKVRFLDKSESFCAYVFHQGGDLLAHNALLIENCGGQKEMFLLHKHSRTVPMVADVRNVSQKSMDEIFSDHGISSVFLLGDDFEEAWMQEHMHLLKSGRRVFVGKNLYVKGACYRGMELKEGRQDYLYLGPEKVCCNIALRSEYSGQESYIPVVEGGKHWYESGTSLDVLLLDKPELEFAVIPIHGREKQTTLIRLEYLPARPEKTTRLHIELEFLNPTRVKLMVKDLGFGELFPQSDMVYEGELQWEQ